MPGGPTLLLEIKPFSHTGYLYPRWFSIRPRLTDTGASIARIHGRPDRETACCGGQVANVLREAIASGSLRAGTTLRQDDPAGQFGFSRMPIRDALRQL
nr:GntR family transcriptional regulator [Mesorhizobium sp. LNHC220B00]